MRAAGHSGYKAEDFRLVIDFGVRRQFLCFKWLHLALNFQDEYH